MKLLPVILASLLVGFAGGCRTAEPPPVARPLVARVYLEALPEQPGTAVTLPLSRVPLTVDPRALLVESDLAGAVLEPAEFGTVLQLVFTPQAARDLYRRTAGAQGLRLVLTLNGTAVAAQRIGDPVTDGALRFYPEVGAAQLPALLADLRSTIAVVQTKLAQKQ
ncbi:MAG: hypothetical protein IPL39_22985 [Opitutaceae bacterium]|nr:hypothetical protein [Opitutaceae bacterium]